MIQGKSIFCYRRSLYNSEYLKSILTSKEYHKKKVLHFNVPYDLSYAYLRFLHTEELPDDPILLIRLAGVAESFLRKKRSEIEEKLTKRCARKINRMITINNVIEFFKLSMKYKTDSVYEVCVKFMLEHLDEVIQTPEFKKLDPLTEKMFMLKVSDFRKKQSSKENINDEKSKTDNDNNINIFY